MASMEIANSRPIIVGEREQQLDMMLHLLEFSQMVVLVTGSSGSGKSTFLNAAGSQLAVHHQVFQLPSSRLLSEDDLIREWSDQLGCHENSASIHLALGELQKRDELFCVLIDDAHLVELPVLIMLAEWSSQYENLRIALAGDDVLLNLAHSVMMELSEKNLFHTIHLSALSDSDMDGFISEYLQQSNFSTTPFSSRQLLQIKQLAKGNTGKLAKLLEKSLSKQASAGVSKFPVGHVAAIVLVAVSLGASYWIKDSAEEEDPLAKIIEQAGQSDALAMMESNVVLEGEPPWGESEEAFPNAGNAGSQSGEFTIAESTNESVIDIEEERAPSQEVAPAIANVANESSKPKVVAPTPEAVAPEKPTEIEFSHPLLKADKNQYVLQLVGVRSKESASRVTEDLKRQLGTSKVSFYETRYQGKPWYVVVYGPIGNQEQARAQVDQIARSTKTKPWVRPVAKIQEDMAKID